MKKLATLALCAGLLFSMSACGGKSAVDDEALDVLEKTVNHLSEMKSATYALDVNVDADEEEASVNIGGGYLAEKQLALTLVADVVGANKDNNKTMEVYFKDNTIYVNAENKKQKVPLDDLMTLINMQAPETEGMQTAFKMDKEAIKPYLKEAKVEGDTLTMVIKSDKINEFAKKAGQNASDVYSMVLSTLNYKDITLTANIKDDFFTKITFDTEASISSGEVNTKMNMKITIELSDINANKPLTFPNFKDYQEQKPEV